LEAVRTGERPAAAGYGHTVADLPSMLTACFRLRSGREFERERFAEILIFHVYLRFFGYIVWIMIDKASLLLAAIRLSSD
jgi:hypothetical protein